MSRPVASRATATSSKHQAPASSDSSAAAIVPTLRVMRLQSPELHQSFAGTIDDTTNSIQSALCLPDSLGVYVGETFTAYLGLLNASSHNNTVIRKVAVSALLQSPSAKWQLSSALDPARGGCDVAPNSGIDTIVSHAILEPGQHILRVEVSYLSTDGNSKSFRKFYRFQVVAPLSISTTVVRAGDAECVVSVLIEWNETTTAATSDSDLQQQPQQLLVSDVEIEPSPGLTAVNIGSPAIETVYDDDPTCDAEHSTPPPNAVQLWDHLALLTSPHGARRYLFRVTAATKDARLRGVAAGDSLGHVVVTWRKAMGETGRLRMAAPIVVPLVQPEFPDPNGAPAKTNFVMYQSGVSVDVAAAASLSSSSKSQLANDMAELLRRLPVTVEPIDPPARMTLHVAQEVQFLIVNHSAVPLNLQLQFASSSSQSQQEYPQGLSVSGASCQTVGQVPPHGGSTVATARFLPLAAGLQRCDGCSIVDLATEREIVQPALFQTFVTRGDDAVANFSQQ